MKRINVPLVSQQVLNAMKSAGASQSKFSDYRIGFREVVSVFGCVPTSHEALDNFIFERRRLCEEGTLSFWKWGITRRCAELLKFFSETDSIELPPLPRWEFLHSPLYNKPSNAQLDDPHNIIGLLWRTRQALPDTGLVEITLHNYDWCGFSKLLKEYGRSGQTQYSHALSQKILSEAYEKCQAGALSKCGFTRLRKRQQDPYCSSFFENCSAL